MCPQKEAPIVPCPKANGGNFRKHFPAAIRRRRRNAAFTISQDGRAGARKLRNCAMLYVNDAASPHYAAAFSWFKRAGSRRQGFTIFNLPLRA
jgi:hypothetical protein